MSPQKIIRAQAREALKNNYVKAAAAFAIGLLPLYIIEGAVTVLACALNLIITDNDYLTGLLYMLFGIPIEIVAAVLLSPLLNGFIRMFYRNAMYSQMDINDLFYYFEKGRYSRTLKLDLSFLLRMFLPFVLFFAPVFVYAGLCSGLNNDFTGTALYSDFYFILVVMSAIVTVLYSLKYFTVFTLYVDNEWMSSRDLFRFSKLIMRGRTGSAAKLIFSYTPWMLLCLTILPLIYVVPYMTQGLTIGAKWMTAAAYERQAQ